VKSAHRIVHAFLFFSTVAFGRVEQLSRTHHERRFRVGYAPRQLVKVRLKKRSLVKVFPRPGVQTFAHGSIHEAISRDNGVRHFKPKPDS
jgi:hypothetical protein